jgi:DNA-directed RNA polymerase specialized sigma24 family protein
MNPASDHDPAREYVHNAVALDQAPLLRYASRLLGDPDRARDVVQDTFVRLVGQPRSEVEGHPAEWLFTVCRNRALDVLRKEGRMKRFAEGEVERLAADSPRPVVVPRFDPAGYARLRAGLEAGVRPLADAVQIEDLINHFASGDASPAEDALAIHAEVAVAPWNPTHRLIRVGIKAEPEPAGGRIRRVRVELRFDANQVRTHRRRVRS